MAAVIRRRVTVTGHVQGVFFRETTRRRAQSRGVAGWVRNCADGTVEQMVRYCRAGPEGARVERADVSDEEAEGLSGFEVRR